MMINKIYAILLQKKIHFPLNKMRNNTIGKTSITKFLGMHLDKILNLKNHIMEVSLKVSKSIGLSNKLNRY